MSLTEEMFLKLKKEEMWTVFKDLQAKQASLDEMNTKLDKLSKLEGRVVKLESELVVSKNANTLLKKELVSLQKSHVSLSQYGRLENVEIAGIPASIKKEDLESTVIALATKIGASFTPADLSACHRLPGDRKDTIIRFPNRKFADSMFANSRKLKGMDLSAILGADHAPVYINASLSPELKRMRWKAKKVQEAGLVARFGTNRRGVFVQKEADGDRTVIEVDSDLDQFLTDGKSLRSVLHGDE